jgi:anti-anti-sigma factor
MLVFRDESKKVIYVTPGSDLVADEAEALCRELLSCTEKDTEMLVLDLARVRTIDSLALNVIISLYESIRKSGGELIVENASHDLKKIFRLMGMDGRLTISQTGWPS